MIQLAIALKLMMSRIGPALLRFWEILKIKAVRLVLQVSHVGVPY